MRRRVDGTTALHAAVHADRLDMVEALLRGRRQRPRPPIDTASRRSIWRAVNGNAGMIARLLDAGADPNAVDPAGETALMTAARTGVPAAMRVLLDRGARVDAREPEFQQTALMIAVRENHAAAVDAAAQPRRDGQRADAQGPHAGVRAALQGHRLRLGRRRHQSRRAARSRPARRGQGRHDAAALRRARRPPGGGAAARRRPAPTSSWPTPTASARC